MHRRTLPISTPTLPRPRHTQSRSRINKATPAPTLPRPYLGPPPAPNPSDSIYQLGDNHDFQGLADAHCNMVAGFIAGRVAQAQVQVWNGVLGAMAAEQPGDFFALQKEA